MDLYLYSCAAAPDCVWQVQLAYSVTENRLTMLGCRGADFLRHFWKDMLSDQGVAWLPGHNIAGRIECNGNFLFYSGGSIQGQREATPGCAGVVDMKHYPAGNVLKYPAVNGLYFHPDGKSLWAVEFNEIFRITPAD